MTIDDCFVSVVAPIYNDAGLLREFVDETTSVLSSQFGNYELVLIDSMSNDETVDVAIQLLEEYSCLRLIQLSRHYDVEVAITCGLDAVIGDVVVVMIPSTDPPSAIIEFVQECRGGNDIVFGVTTSRPDEGIATRVLSRGFFWLAKTLCRVDFPRRATCLQGLSRRAVNAIVQIRDKNRHVRALSAQIGFKATELSYSPVTRKKQTRRRFLESVDLAFGVILSHSRNPLHIASLLGLLASIANLAYVCYIVFIYLYKDDVVEGWTTLSMQNAVMFFFVFLILTVISEYTGRILGESRDRPLYHILDDRSSTVQMADSDRRNVVESAISRLRTNDEIK